MPKSTFQVFSDVNTKVVSGYVEGKSGGSGKVVTERVDNVMGSSAGAGSGEFHMYLSSRNRENFRLESIDAQRKQEEEEKAFKEKLALNKLLDDQKTAKNVKKRQRIKQKKEENRKKAKLQKQNNGVADTDNKDGDETKVESEESDEEEKQEY